MFQLQDIYQAHAKVKSGADFPSYVRDLVQLGVMKYDTFVGDGHEIFYGDDRYSVESGPVYEALPVAGQGNPEGFIRILKEHQQGLTDYPTFCRQAAENGVEKWTVDLQAMTCTYFDRSGLKMLVEQIPAG